MALVSRLLEDLAARRDLLDRISQIDVADPHNAIVLLDGEPAQLRLGDRDFTARLARYEEFAPALRAQRAVLEYFDLRFGDRLWVK
jgi:hypothetical protein